VEARNNNSEVVKDGRCLLWGLIGAHVTLIMIYGVTTHTYVCKLSKAFDEYVFDLARKIRSKNDFGLTNPAFKLRVQKAFDPYITIRRKVAYCYCLTLGVIFVLAMLYSCLIACFFKRWIDFYDFPIPTPYGLLYKTKNPLSFYAVSSAGYFCLFARCSHVFGYPFSAVRVFLSSKSHGVCKEVMDVLENLNISVFHVLVNHENFQYVIYASDSIYLGVLLAIFFVQ